MTKLDILRLIKLLSAIESVMLVDGKRVPDYLLEDMEKAVENLTEELLK
ncbi:MAG: hypothetical protein KGI54_08745 [Pseudomonadota bacterium]|nr:hypothetical protein [Pseudomonadota bacterium]